jgi:hypothetical protein
LTCQQALWNRRKSHPTWTCTVKELVHMHAYQWHVYMQTRVFNAMRTLPDLTRIYLNQSFSKLL